MIETLLLATALSAQTTVQAETPWRVEDALKAFDAKVASMNAEFAKIPRKPEAGEWFRKDLTHLSDLSAYVRRASAVPFDQKFSDEERRAYEDGYETRFLKYQGEITAEFKSVLKGKGWPTIGRFGKDADQDAQQIVTNSHQDPDFQAEMVQQLLPLAKKKDTNVAGFTALADKVALNAAQGQPYGTQGKCKDGKWETETLDDAELVDARRKELGLPTLADVAQEMLPKCK